MHRLALLLSFVLPRSVLGMGVLFSTFYEGRVPGRITPQELEVEHYPWPMKWTRDGEEVRAKASTD